jgi:tetratricopeptide (TPR) repeat protein
LVAEAAQLAARLLEQFPDDVRAVELAGSIQYRIGQTAAALQSWERCLRLDPRAADVRLSRGTFYIESGDFVQAESELRTAWAQSPNSHVAHLLGQALLNQGKGAEAVEVLERSLVADRRAVPNLVVLGQAYLQQKQDAKARECFLAATREAPAFANAYFGLAAACARLGEPTEAARYRDKFHQLQSQHLQEGIAQSKRYNDVRTTQQSVAEAYVAAGRLYLSRGDERAAEQHWTRAAELDPQDPDARAELAQLLVRQSRPREALAVLEPLRESRVQDPGLWLRLGQLHAQLQEFDQAEAALRRAVELAPQQAAGYAALADLLRAQRRTDDAAGAIDKALQLAPGNQQYQQLQLLIRQGQRQK